MKMGEGGGTEENSINFISTTVPNYDFAKTEILFNPQWELKIWDKTGLLWMHKVLLWMLHSKLTAYRENRL